MWKSQEHWRLACHLGGLNKTKRREGGREGRTYRRRGSDHVDPQDLEGGERVDREAIGVAKGKAEEEDDHFSDIS